MVAVDHALVCGDNVVALDGLVQRAARQELANTLTTVSAILHLLDIFTDALQGILNVCNKKIATGHNDNSINSCSVAGA